MNDPAMLLCIIQYSSKTVRDNENRESDVNKAKNEILTTYSVDRGWE